MRAMSIQNRYSRHELLKELGAEGQKSISASKVLVIGAGGLGSAACLYLAGSGVGHLTIVDHDKVDLTNLQRQVIHTEARIGQSKAVSAQRSAQALNSAVDVTAVSYKPDKEELTKLVAAHDVILDCTDNTESRYLLNELCKANHKPLVTAGAVSFYGQITVLDFRDKNSPCYACIFPNHEGEDEKASTLGVYAPLVGTLGCMQAAEALKIIAGIGKPLTGRLLMIDFAKMEFKELKYSKSEECPLCGRKNK